MEDHDPSRRGLVDQRRLLPLALIPARRAALIAMIHCSWRKTSPSARSSMSKCSKNWLSFGHHLDLESADVLTLMLVLLFVVVPDAQAVDHGESDYGISIVCERF